MNKLKLIEQNSETNGKNYTIEVQLTAEGETFSQVVKYSSPIDEKFRDDLKWYFKEYLLQAYKHRKRASWFLEDLSKQGKSMGEKIFGGEYQDSEVSKKLSEMKLEEIFVTIESERLEFFEEPWEILLLPSSEKCLSTSCAGFVRTGSRERQPEVHLELSTEKPLRVLFVTTRPTKNKELIYQAKSYEIFDRLLEYESSFEVEVLYPPTWEAFEEKLDAEKNHFHVVHFDGPCDMGDSCPYGHLLFEDEEGQADFCSVAMVAEVLNDHGAEVLLLDNCLENTYPAMGFLLEGVKNIVTMNFLTYTFCKIQFFQILYTQIASGNSLSKAIVESRNFMKTHPFRNALLAQSHEHHDWPLAAHYSIGEVIPFSAKQQDKPILQTKGYFHIRQKMVEFLNSFLPPHVFFGREDENHAIRRSLSNGKITIVCGSPGMGKTHLLHHFSYWYVAGKQAEKAFYFDFDLSALDKDKIVDHVNQVLNLGQSNETKEEVLWDEKFLLVFDNFEARKSLSSEKQEELDNFVHDLSAKKVRILIAMEKESDETFSSAILVPLARLSPLESRALAATVLRKNQWQEEEGDSEYFDLVDELQGHPLLMQNLLSKLGEDSTSEILKEYREELKAKESSSEKDPIANLLESGWNNLPKDFQIILAALADFSGIITDGLSIAFDMREYDPAPGQELYSCLEVTPPHRTSEVILAGVQAGFFAAKPFGKEILPPARRYLLSKRDSYQWPSEKLTKIQFLLAKLNILELRVLSAYIAHSPEPMLMQKILENHKRWLDSLELLWHNQEYAFLISGKYLFASILQKIGIKNELEEWSFRLIQSSDLSTLDSSSDFSSAWLKIASDAILSQAAKDSEVTKQWIEYWQTKLPDIEDESVFDNALMFLEAYYRNKEDWPSRLEISQQALQYYQKKENYQRVIASLKSLARCEEAMGNIEKCKECEKQLLEEVPYEKLEEGMKQKSTLDVIFCQMNREEYEEAQELLNDFRKMPEVAELPLVADTFQGDIYIKLDKLEEATAIYSELWSGVINKKHVLQPEKISKTLMDLESKLGKERFEEIFQEKAPGVDSPSQALEKQKAVTQNAQMG